MFHLHHGHVDGIQQGSASERLATKNPPEDRVRIRGKRNGRLRPLAELDQEELVLPIGSLEEGGSRLRGLTNLVVQASARLNQQTDVNESVFLGTMANLLSVHCVEYS